MNRDTTRELDGLWHVAPISHELRRTGADPGLEHEHWPQVPVPGHWANYLSDADGGPFLYRHRFQTTGHEVRKVQSGSRYWLRFDGVMSGAEVWLDGQFLGDVVGYFAQHRFDVTTALSKQADHVVAVDVACPSGGGVRFDDRANSSSTGALQTGPFAATVNPGGIWQSVSIEETGPVAIRHSRVLCTEATRDRAKLRFRVTLDSTEATEVTVTTTLDRSGRSVAEIENMHPLAAGENRLEWEVSVDRPERWWPSSLGEQPLYDLTLTVAHDGAVSDRRHWQTGLRTVEMKDFIWTINGQRLFMKSVAYGPTTPFVGQEAGEQLANDVRNAQQAGFDMMRIFAHVARPEVYQAADQLGVLLWQDLPLIGGYSSKVRRASKVMIQQTVDKLGHHPSVVAWGGHVLPNGNAVDLPAPDASLSPASPGIRLAKSLAKHITPTWNRGVLDSIVGRELKQADNTRPVITRSASLPSPSDPGGSDTFLWFGWRIGSPGDLANLVRRWPRLVAFPGGIGSQSVAKKDWDLDPALWAGAERESFDRYVPRTAFDDGFTWADATRDYQADLLAAHVELFRTLKYKPTGGFCLFALVDNHPDGGFGLLDQMRRPKPAYDRMVKLLEPVVVMADPLPQTVTPGQDIEMAIRVVNDLPADLESATVTGTATAGASSLLVHQQGWASDVAADSCGYVGTLRFRVPDSLGPLTVTLRLQATHLGEPLEYETSYETIVIRG